AAPTEAPAGPKAGGTLVFARASEAQGLDPHLQTAFSSFVVLEFIFESLFAYGDNMELEPRLAESYEWSDDGLTLTVKLRPNVKFHNGDDMTAEDVKFSYERILNEETGAAARSYFTSITEINVIDPLTVEFKLDKADATILSAMVNADILDKKLIEGGADPATEVVGTGPFMLEEWQPDKVLMLAKNPNYWMPGLPLLDKIEMRVIPDEAAILAAMRAGEVDFAQFNDPTIALTAEQSGGDVQLLRQPALAYHVLQLNPARDIFKDERVRNAISCALDRQQVIDSAALGEGKVTPPITNPFFAAPLDELNCYKPDLEKAKQLLADAGVSDLSFTIMAASDEPPTAVAEAQSIQAQLAEIGVTVEIEVLELGVYVQRWLDADFDATVALNGGGAEPALEMGRYWEHGGTFTDVSNWQTDEIDALLKEARVETDQNKRKELYLEVQKQLAAASPWVWMYVGYDYRAVQPWVKDFVFPPNGANIHLREAWLDK
ncbi:MAG TPA: ABC transporter substrate-binding protein, partial [Anaerolineaceae bacterium]|nr:ABC transporter substrate-binding protein [Anaerolineaceae bacterium]